MTTIELKILLIISKLVKFQSFIIITIIVLAISLCNRKIRKSIVKLYIMYFLGIFVMFFPINRYGANIITFNFLKRKLTPKSFLFYKKDTASKKTLKEKIILSYSLSRDIKYQIKKLDNEIEAVEKELKNVKGINKNFILWIDTTDKI